MYVSAAVPYELSGATQASIVVTYLGQTTATATVPIAASSPGIFTYSSSGLLGGAPVLNVDGTVNTGGNPSAVPVTVQVGNNVSPAVNIAVQ
jgi:uncharacterized protein (TIGR03437 family)